MSKEPKLFKITRGDGAIVEFRGQKVCHAGKAALFKTVGGNYVFQYAPYGNRIGLIVEKLPSRVSDARELVSKHADERETHTLMAQIGSTNTIHID